MTLPSPRHVSLMLMLPQPADFISHLHDHAVTSFTECREAGWVKQEGGMFRRTELGDAALKQAHKEPVR